MMSVIQGTVNENAMDRNEKFVPVMSSDCQKPFKSVLVSSSAAYLNVKVLRMTAKIPMRRG